MPRSAPEHESQASRVRRSERAVRDMYDVERPSSHKRGYTKRWQKLRLIVLGREPLCRVCRAKGITTAATEVDHIVPLSRGGGNDFGNLQPLCKPCHSRKTNAEDGGFGRKHGG